MWTILITTDRKRIEDEILVVEELLCWMIPSHFELRFQLKISTIIIC
jgi:hypothetical protein